MAIRRPSGRLILITKEIYPRGAYRLPTGGIHHGEGVLASLLRETCEETGLDVEVRRFLAAIAYRPSSDTPERGSAGAEPPPALFHTFAFLLDERGGTLGSLDPSERISSYREIAPGELTRVADRLEAIGSEPSPEIQGDWADWGRFRAVVHRAVHTALTRPAVHSALTRPAGAQTDDRT